MADKSKYIIDASGKTLGRVASLTAKTLMGKTEPGYTPHIPSGIRVSVVNVSKLSISDRKKLGKKYTTYSGYPGGLKTEALGALRNRKGSSEPLRRAIQRMLPRNTMLVGRMKNLRITL